MYKYLCVYNYRYTLGSYNYFINIKCSIIIISFIMRKMILCYTANFYVDKHILEYMLPTNT